MWLLNIDTGALEYFEGSSTPEYAILSHRWTSDEVSFHDVINGHAEKRRGYPKIANFCAQVRLDGVAVSHIWIDTCCIDKSNNSELSEAINSMYKWYRRAKVCYAFLADVSHGDNINFVKSVWFERGWTLQELLAPIDVQFFDKNWINMGTKLELSDLITEATGIPADALRNFDSRRSPHSVADRMSWAARRRTTREEDLAYSLLGIFGVNMPLLYGEGSRAFLRLQEEILKISEDLTIFAWSIFPRIIIPSNDYLRDLNTHDFGLFAATPESYGHAGLKFRNLLDDSSFSRSQYLESFFSGAGLAINLVLVPYRPDIYIAPLCEVVNTSDQAQSASPKIAAMFLERTQFKGRYRRINYDGQSLALGHTREMNLALGRTQRVVIERTPYYAMARQPRGKYGFNILHIEDDLLRLFQVSNQDNVEIVKRNPSYQSMFMDSGDVGIAGMIHLCRRKLPPIYFHFGFDFDFNPFCLISRPTYQNSQNQEHKIEFGNHMIPVGCNTGVLHLVSRLRAESRKSNLQQHNVELHMGSWTLQDMQFVGRDCRIGLDLSAGHEHGYVYHVEIGLAHKQYPWSTDLNSNKWDLASREEVKWHSERWNNDQPD